MQAISLLACAGLLASLPASTAAQGAPQEEPVTRTVEVKKTKLLRAGADVIGTRLVNEKNEPLGEAEDLILHPKGEVAFVVFTGAGALDTGANHYPVPWAALDRNEHGQLVLATTPEKFRGMPRYDQQPEQVKMDWWVEADRKYARLTEARATPVQASVSLAPAKMLYAASSLRARSIENADGEKIATMQEIVIDPSAGRIAYAVLSVGGSAGTPGKMVAVPWEALESMPDKSNPELERLTLATTREQLEKAPEFLATAEGWVQACEPGYV